MKKNLAAIALIFAALSASAQQFINHKGQDIFVCGINMAWMNFARDLDGFDQRRFAETMDDIKNAGGNATRWWIHINGTETPTFRGDTVTGISQRAINNFVAAMDIAAEKGIVVSVCLWSFDMLVKDQVSTALRARNKRFLESAELTQHYIDKALLPLVNATKSHPAILCWEIFNEPEGMTRIGNWSHTDKVNMSDVQRFINQCAGAIRRADPSAKVSSGCWNSKAISYNKSISSSAWNYYADSNLVKIGGDPDGYLDFYQVHFYPDYSGDNESPFHNPVEYYQLDKPLVVGEFSAYGIVRQPGARFSVSSELTPEESFKWLIDKGYAGGLAWTYTNHDGHGGLDDIRSALAYLNNNYPELVNIKRSANFNYMPYATKDMPDTSVYLPETPLEIAPYLDLADYFADSESELTYETESLGIVEAYISDASLLNLRLKDTVGYGKVTITAIDAGGKRLTGYFYVFCVDTIKNGNLALNKAVYASSYEGSSREAYFVNDGKKNTRWSSNYSDNQWLTIDLHAPAQISRVVLHWENAYGREYEIQVSGNGIDWQTVFYTNAGKQGINNIVFDQVEARYVKFKGIKRGSSWGYSLYELEIFADNGQNSNSAPYISAEPKEIDIAAGKVFKTYISVTDIKDGDGDLLDYGFKISDGEIPDWINIVFNDGHKFIEGTPPAEAIGSLYTFNFSGTDYFGQTAQLTYSFKVTEANLTSLNNMGNGLKIYQLPGKDTIAAEADSKISLLEVYDFAGRQIYAAGLSGATALINTENWPEGLYIIRAVTESGEATGSFNINR
jgi:hypothetical protein